MFPSTQYLRVVVLDRQPLKRGTKLVVIRAVLWTRGDEGIINGGAGVLCTAGCCIIDRFSFQTTAGASLVHGLFVPLPNSNAFFQ